MLFDAHMHLASQELFDRLHAKGAVRCVLNGTHVGDWEQVGFFAEHYPETVFPSFGLHPWYHPVPGWREKLSFYLERFPQAGLGEIGLHRGKGASIEEQERFFLEQLELAEQRVISIHCVGFFGRMFALLEQAALPRRGFLLHDYTGSLDMARRFVKLGGFFSFSMRAFLPSRARQRAVWLALLQEAPHRLLLESDAPFSALPRLQCCPTACFSEPLFAPWMARDFLPSPFSEGRYGENALAFFLSQDANSSV